MNTLKKIVSTVATVATLGIGTSAFAEAYPSQPIKFVTGTQTGGMASTLARTLAEALPKRLGQPVIVQDKPGAAGVIAAKYVMAAAPNGYTLHVGGINPHPLLEKQGVDLLEEMEIVGMVSSVPMVFITTASKPLDSVGAVAEYAKGNPGQLNFGSSGGNLWNLMMTLFARNAGGFTYTHVPYKGSADLQLALPRGDVQITMVTPPSALPMVKANQARAIMIAAPERSPFLPNVPTPAQVGLPPFAVNSSMYLWVPKGTPRDVIQKLSTAMLAVENDAEYIKDVTNKTGAPPPALTPEQARERYAAEVQQLREALQDPAPPAKP